MGPIGRIIFERADGSGFYAHAWDATLAAGLLQGGALTLRQGGNAYAYQGTTTPPVQADAPLVLAVDTRPALTALQASVAAIPTAAAPDYSAALATVQAGLVALAKAVPPDVTQAVTALAAAVAKIPTAPPAGALGNAALTLANGASGGTLVWLPSNPNDTPPTITTTATVTALNASALTP